MKNTQGWTVTLTCEAIVLKKDHGTADDLLEALSDYGAALAGEIPAAGREGEFLPEPVELTLSVETRDGASAVAAAQRAEKLVSKAGIRVGLIFHVVATEVETWEAHDARLEQPAFPTLVGVAELADLLDVSRQRASELKSRPGFPEPLQMLASGPVWLRSSVQQFAESWERKPGRPKKVDVDVIDTAISNARAAAKRLDSEFQTASRKVLVRDAKSGKFQEGDVKEPGRVR